VDRPGKERDAMKATPAKTPTGIAGGVRRRVREHAWRILRPVRLGALGRTEPLSREWGYDRGKPIDRYYIDAFIERHRADITGRVLEIKDSRYTQRFGTSVTQRDVLDINAENPRATFVADLAAADVVPSDAFDCCIVTQTLQYIFDVHAGVRHLHRVLRPGGVLLATVPVLSKLLDPAMGYTDYWRFTPDSCNRLFGDVFGKENFALEGHGNVLTSIAFLSGMAQEELSRADFGHEDPLYPLILTIRAVKR
jgi:SAM-dependent methyltransferase